MIRFLGIGGLFGVLSWFIASPVKPGLEGVNELGLALGLSVVLLGTISDLKECELKHKSETK